jgi:thioredoxin-like negative regulator of GroEL
MSATIRCPDCGKENPAGSESCAACGFPLAGETEAAAAGSQRRSEPPSSFPVEPPRLAPGEAAAEPGPGSGPGPGVAASRPAPGVARPLPFRPRRQRPRPTAQALSLWLVFGTFCALVLVWVAFKANYDRAVQPVPGSSQAQQSVADSLQRALARDSTNLEARVRLADILYDTGNWADAIVHYRSALRQDSSLATALVDLGVCHYNLGHTQEAERHFLLALQRDPHQPVALFNLGIVYERRGEHRKALQHFHRALQSDPPEAMREPLLEAMTRVQAKIGKPARPLPEGS